jgi:hypothetical protein
MRLLHLTEYQGGWRHGIYTKHTPNRCYRKQPPLLQFTSAHSLTHCSQSGYPWRNRVNNASFVSFCNHALSDIQSQARPQLRGCSHSQLPNCTAHCMLAITASRWKAKAEIAEWANSHQLSDAKHYKELVWVLSKPVMTGKPVVRFKPGTGSFRGKATALAVTSRPSLLELVMRGCDDGTNVGHHKRFNSETSRSLRYRR